MRTKSTALAVALALSAAAVAEQERPRFFVPQEVRRAVANDTQKVHSTPPPPSSEGNDLLDELLGGLLGSHKPSEDQSDGTDITTVVRHHTVVVTPTRDAAPVPTDPGDSASHSTPSINSPVIVGPGGLVPFNPSPTAPTGASNTGAPINLTPQGSVRPSDPASSNAGSQGTSNGQTDTTPSSSGGSSSTSGGLLDPLDPIVSDILPSLPPILPTQSKSDPILPSVLPSLPSILPSQSKSDSSVNPSQGSPVLPGVSPTFGTGASLPTAPGITTPTSPLNGSPSLGESSPPPTSAPEQSSSSPDLPLVPDLSSLVGGVVGGGSGSSSSSSSSKVPSAVQQSSSITPQNPSDILGATGLPIPSALPSALPTILPTILPTSLVPDISTPVQNSSLVNVPTAIGVPTDILPSVPTSAPTILPSDVPTDVVPTMSVSLPSVPIGNATSTPTLSEILSNLPTIAPTVALPTVPASLPTGSASLPDVTASMPTASASLPTSAPPVVVNGTSSQVPTSGVSSPVDIPTSSAHPTSGTTVPTASAAPSSPVQNSTLVGSSSAAVSESSASASASATKSLPTHAEVTSAPTTGSSEASSPLTTPTSTPPPVTSIRPTATLTNTEWLPTQIMIASTSAQPPVLTRSASPGTSTTALPSNIPKFIAPDDASTSVPQNSVLVHICFLYELNYEFVSGQPVAASQIFTWLPMALAYSQNLPEDSVHVQSLRPYDTRSSLGYMTTCAEFWWAESGVQQLQMDVLAPNSRLYNYPMQNVIKLTQEINTAFPIQGQSVPGSPSDPSSSPTSPSNAGNDAFGSPASNEPQNSHQIATVAGIAVGAVGVGAIYGAAMFIVARRYKRKKQAHRRASSLDQNSLGSSEMHYSDNGSPALMGGAILSREATGNEGVAESRNSHGSGASSVPTGRTANISGPVAAENSLGWN